jgi:hypothetical protein
MSAQPQNAIGALEAEVLSSEAINEVVAQCFADCPPERALEFATTEEIAAIDDADNDSETQSEIETAEEVSLKNGVYHEIRRKLGERFDIPPDEIAFIHEADTPAKKRRFQSGKCRASSCSHRFNREAWNGRQRSKTPRSSPSR